MRIYDECERHILFGEGDEMPDEIMTHPVREGGNRRRMQPTSLVVRWEKHQDSPEWRLSRVYIFGHQVHKTTSNSFIHYVYQLKGPQWSDNRTIEVDENIPEWVVHHVALSHPLFSAMVYSAVLDTLYTILGIPRQAS